MTCREFAEFLDAFLAGSLPVEQAGHGGEDASPLLAVRPLDRGDDLGHGADQVGMTGRTSTTSIGHVCASASAWSRSAQSIV